MKPSNLGKTRSEVTKSGLRPVGSWDFPERVNDAAGEVGGQRGLKVNKGRTRRGFSNALVYRVKKKPVEAT